MKDSLYYRSFFRKLFVQYKTPASGENNDSFREYLEQVYREERQKIDLDSCSGIQINLTGLSLIATTLFLFGRLDVTPDIVRGLADVKKTGLIGIVLNCLALLPLPNGLSALTAPQQFLEWFSANSEALTWNEQEGRYIWTRTHEIPQQE